MVQAKKKPVTKPKAKVISSKKTKMPLAKKLFITGISAMVVMVVGLAGFSLIDNNSANAGTTVAAAQARLDVANAALQAANTSFTAKKAALTTAQATYDAANVKYSELRASKESTATINKQKVVVDKAKAALTTAQTKATNAQKLLDVKTKKVADLTVALAKAKATLPKGWTALPNDDDLATIYDQVNHKQVGTLTENYSVCRTPDTAKPGFYKAKIRLTLSDVKIADAYKSMVAKAKVAVGYTRDSYGKGGSYIAIKNGTKSTTEASTNSLKPEDGAGGFQFSTFNIGFPNTIMFSSAGSSDPVAYINDIKTSC